jgi:hypothetical protein
MDTFDDEQIRIEVVRDVSAVEAEVVVVAAGVTASSPTQTRRDLAVVNHAILEHVADQWVARLSKALFIVVRSAVGTTFFTNSAAAGQIRASFRPYTMSVFGCWSFSLGSTLRHRDSCSLVFGNEWTQIGPKFAPLKQARASSSYTYPLLPPEPWVVNKPKFYSVIEGTDIVMKSSNTREVHTRRLLFLTRSGDFTALDLAHDCFLGHSLPV